MPEIDDRSVGGRPSPSQWQQLLFRSRLVNDNEIVVVAVVSTDGVVPSSILCSQTNVSDMCINKYYLLWYRGIKLTENTPIQSHLDSGGQQQ